MTLLKPPAGGRGEASQPRSGYLGPFAPRYLQPGQRGVRIVHRSHGDLPYLLAKEHHKTAHTPDGPPIDEPPPFPEPLPERDPAKEPIEPPIL